MVGNRLFDLFADPDEYAGREAPRARRLVNPQLDPGGARRLASDPSAATTVASAAATDGPADAALVPSRIDVVERLDAEGLLPAIMFIFSRKGCDAAVQQCLRTNLRLTTPAERGEIRAFVESKAAVLADADLDVLGYDEWARGADPWHLLAPRRDAADLQGVRRGAVLAAAWSRWCSRPRRWRWASTCRPGRS